MFPQLRSLSAGIAGAGPRGIAATIAAIYRGLGGPGPVDPPGDRRAEPATEQDQDARSRTVPEA